MTSPYGCAEAIGCDNCECKEECLDIQRNIYEEEWSKLEVKPESPATMSEEEHIYWERVAERRNKRKQVRK